MSVRVQFRTRRIEKALQVELTAGDECCLGSEGDVAICGKGVRSKHARIFMSNSDLHIEAIDRAPLAVNGKPADLPTPIADGDWLALGATILQVGVSLRDQPAPGPPERTFTTSLTSSSIRPVVIGRSPDCDFTVASPVVSRRHAQLLHDNGRVWLEDLESTNGTFVNRQRIAGRVPIQPGDKVEIATFAFIFTGEALVPAGLGGRVRLEAHEICKEVRDNSTGNTRRLLDRISLVVEPGEFVGIFGTSGSGKSTLLDALNGRRPASSGRVLYNGNDFYSSFDLFRTAIGYVPQQDIVHRKISLRDALRYTARLRLPPDTSREEIQFHVDRVLRQVGLSDKASCRIDTPSPLSGGQFKRVSLAVELIANPNILFLDEVTSGLDAGTDKKMMQLFAELAAQQKTVICVTHTLENIDACHLVVLLHQGKAVYFGPPKGALDHFHVSRLSEVYELIETQPADHWAERFSQSSYHQTYIANRTSSSGPKEDPGQSIHLRGPLPKRALFPWLQLLTLLRRYMDLLVSDRRNLAILLLQAPLISILVGLVFDLPGPIEGRAVVESQVAFILVLSAIWCGCLNSTREVVKELPIYLRERAVNLRIPPYLFSKLLPLAVLCSVQCLIMLAIVTMLLSWSGNFMSRFCILFLAGMAATTMGLAVSTLVDSNDKAMTLIPLLLIPQVILSNFIVRLGKVGGTVAQGTIIAFSSFDAMKATLSKELSPLVAVDRTFLMNLSTLSFLCTMFVAIALMGLKRKDLKVG